MRCDEVILRLSGPGAAREDSAVSEHLSGCDRCAAWAARGSRLERLWEATRPSEVTNEGWERAWQTICSGLDQTAATSDSVRVPLHRDLPSRPNRWRSVAMIGMIGLAQAAALMLAVGLAWRDPSRRGPSSGEFSPSAVAEWVQPSLDTEFEIYDGQVALILADGQQVQLIDLAERDAANRDDPWFEFFNRVEAASAVVAMTE